MPKFILALAIPTLAYVLAAAAPAASSTLLDPNAYQVFVRHWNPASAPFCAAIASTEQWSDVLHPAAVMRGHKLFAPPASFWQHHAVLFVARTLYAGATTGVFRLRSVERARESTTVSYAFHPTPYASSTMSWWMGVVVDKPLSKPITFRENGRNVCTLSAAR